MPAIFTGRWTRGHILDEALERVGNVKLKHRGREKLNRVLEELYAQWEWPFLYKVSSFTLPASNQGGNLSIYASVALPADYLKSEQERTGLTIVTLDGTVSNQPIAERDPIAFRQQAIPSDQEGPHPVIWYGDHADRFLYFWPRPTQACVAQLIYKHLPADAAVGTGTDAATTAYDADIPLFPWGGYLAMEMEAWGHEYEENIQRAGMVRQDCLRALDRIRNVAMPRHTQESTVPLDPDVFGPAFRPE